jgi:hypothetical protein
VNPVPEQTGPLVLKPGTLTTRSHRRPKACIIIIINESTALYWALNTLQILDPIQSCWDNFERGSARLSISTHLQENTNLISAYRYPCLRRNSNPQARRVLCDRPRKVSIYYAPYIRAHYSRSLGKCRHWTHWRGESRAQVCNWAILLRGRYKYRDMALELRDSQRRQ